MVSATDEVVPYPLVALLCTFDDTCGNEDRYYTRDYSSPLAWLPLTRLCVPIFTLMVVLQE